MIALRPTSPMRSNLLVHARCISGRELATALLLALLTACAGGPVAPTDGGSAGKSDSDYAQLPPDTGEETAYTQRLAQAESLLGQGYLYAAASILSDLSYSKLTGRERIRMLSLQTQTDIQLGKTSAALARLSAALPQLTPLDAALLQPLHRWHIQLTEAELGTLAAAQTADALLSTAQDEVTETLLIEQIWGLLQRTPAAALDAALATADGHWSGWLELAVQAADTLESPAMQRVQLSLWQQRHSDHKAALRLPAERQTLLLSDESAADPVGRVALLLPLSGTLKQRGDANAILQGYMTAAFEAEKRGWPSQELMVMNLLEHPDLPSAYASARRAGAELVIALTGSPKAASIDAQAESPLLILESNPSAGFDSAYRDASEKSVHVSSLTSNPNDEIIDLVRRAFVGGRRRAMLLRPADSWGDKRSDQIAGEWAKRGAALPANAVYSGQADYSSSITAALNIDASKQRYKRLRQILGESAEFFPRRRQDLDSVFLLSRNPQEGRSLKPLLAFHYAGDLPVFASSQTFSGRRDAQRDRDLNSATVMLSPWVLEAEGRLQSVLLHTGSETLSDQQALGADAFVLQWRLATGLPAGTTLRGFGGMVWWDANGHIVRERQAARFVDGLPIPLL